MLTNSYLVPHIQTDYPNRSVESDQQRNLLIDECVKLTKQKLDQYPESQRKKLSQQDISNYRLLIFELTQKFRGTADSNGTTPSPIELVNLIDRCFTYRALDHKHMGIEYFFLMMGATESATEYLEQNLAENVRQRDNDNEYKDIYLSELITNYIRNLRNIDSENPIAHGRDDLPSTIINLNPINQDRERLKSIIVNQAVQDIDNKHRQMFRDEYTTNPDLTPEQLAPEIVEQETQKRLNQKIANNLELEIQIVLYDTAKKINKNFHQRFFSNIIGTNTWVKLASTILSEYTKKGIYIVSEPGVFYLLIAMIGSDIFSNIIKESFYPTKEYYLRLTLTSVVAAAISAPWVALEENIGYRAIIAGSVFAAITLADAILIKLPIHKKYHSRSRWGPDYFPYEIGGPINPARIFMTSNLPVLMAGVYNIFGIDKSSPHYYSGVTWGITAAITQLFQTLYFRYKLPRYAKEAEKNHGLPQWDLLQLYGLTRNYSVRVRQAENIFSTLFTSILSELSFSFMAIYPEAKWLPWILWPIVWLGGPRIAALFQIYVFNTMELPSSPDREYFEELYNQKELLGLEFSNSTKLRKFLSRKSNKPLTIFERQQITDLTLQTGRARITNGERHLESSITSIALFYVILHYIWTRGISYGLNQNKDTELGSWTYLSLHFISIVFVVTLIRLTQFAVYRLDKVETMKMESFGIFTRACRAGAALFIDAPYTALKELTKTNEEVLTAGIAGQAISLSSRISSASRTLFIEGPKKAWARLKENVFIIKDSQNRIDLDTRAKELNQEQEDQTIIGTDLLQTDLPIVVNAPSTSPRQLITRYYQHERNQGISQEQPIHELNRIDTIPPEEYIPSPITHSMV